MTATQIENRDDSDSYTFPGYARRTLAALPHDLGLLFPAFLTHKAALSERIIDLMPPLFVKGVRPEALSATILGESAYVKLNI